MEKQKVGVKMTLPYEEAVAYMEDLLESLKSGKIVVQTGEDFVNLTPAEQIGIEVAAKAKKGKQKFSFEMTWTEDKSGSLTISDKEPAIAMPPAGEVVSKEAAEVVKKEEAKVPAKKTASEAAPAKKSAPKKAAKKAPAKKKVAKRTATAQAKKSKS